jgi:hypothetical protein
MLNGKQKNETRKVSTSNLMEKDLSNEAFTIRIKAWILASFKHCVKSTIANIIPLK